MLPFPLREQLVGRVDQKAERDERRLLALAAWDERGVKTELVASALGTEVRRPAAWLSLHDGNVVVRRRSGLALSLAAMGRTQV